MRTEEYKEILEEILEYRLSEIGIGLEFYKENKEDEYDTIIELCLDGLESDATND